MISYCSPVNKSKLIKNLNYFIDDLGNKFHFFDDIPNFTYPFDLSISDQESINWYKSNAQTYDEFLPLTFKTFNVSEDYERDKIINKLNLEVGNSVLEIGCGTGRDSLKIADKIGINGSLYLQDISYDILKLGITKLNSLLNKPMLNFSIGNGSYLPFPDNSFDKVFHFGGLNTFGDKRRALAEMTRVAKPGGKIVVGDENMPSWLRNTEFGKVLMNSNPHYKFDIPIDLLPIESRNVSIEWIIGGVFYIISFDKGNGEPYADLDFTIPGIRGGTHRTRYYGHLEGLSPEAIDLAKKARLKSGMSMYDWLNYAVKSVASKDI